MTRGAQVTPRGIPPRTHLEDAEPRVAPSELRRVRGGGRVRRSRRCWVRKRKPARRGSSPPEDALKLQLRAEQRRVRRLRRRCGRPERRLAAESRPAVAPLPPRRAASRRRSTCSRRGAEGGRRAEACRERVVEALDEGGLVSDRVLRRLHARAQVSAGSLGFAPGRVGAHEAALELPDAAQEQRVDVGVTSGRRVWLSRVRRGERPQRRRN